MKKLILTISILAVALLFPAVSSADSWHHDHHHGHYRPQVREVVKYYPRPYREVIRYYPRPRPVREVITYYPRPRAYFAPPPPVYYGRPQYNGYGDNRSSTGLAGGVIGGVFGYQLGNGDPLATGIGAAAGSYLGNEIAR